VVPIGVVYGFEILLRNATLGAAYNRWLVTTDVSSFLLVELGPPTFGINLVKAISSSTTTTTDIASAAMAEKMLKPKIIY